MRKKKDSFNRKIFGGVNFLIVFWALLSLLRLVVAFNEVTFSDFLIFDIFTFIVPILFLLVLNVFLGISQFLPKRGNNLWALSLIIATASLIAINSFNIRIVEIKGIKTQALEVVEF